MTEKQIVWYILLTEVKIDSDTQSVTSLSVAPLEYYPRFCYRKAIDLGIEFPFEVSHEYCMVAELIPGATENVKGMVCYPTDFK